MTNSVGQDQTISIGSGSTLFASLLKLVSNVRQSFAADDFSKHLKNVIDTNSID